MPASIVDGELLPDWLSAADAPWLRELLLAASAFDGHPFSALAASWQRGEVPPRAGARWRPVLATLRELLVPRRARSMDLAAALGVARATEGATGRGRAAKGPDGPRLLASDLRRIVFGAVAGGASREQALAAGAAATGLSGEAVSAALLADLGEQRRVCWPAGLDVDRLRRETNGRFARALLATADRAELSVSGQSRAVLRTAWLHGAHFRFVASEVDGARLAWAPPPGDERAGRRLAALMAVLPWAQRFVLRAACRWRARRCTLVLTSLDALPVGEAPAPFDSRLEAEVAARLRAALVGFQLVREPAPLPLGQGLAFPDFLLRRVAAAGEREPAAWWIELAGLRDPAALAGKVTLLEREPHYVLCVPRGRCPAALAEHARVVVFGRGRNGVRQIVAGVVRVVGAG
ncbi:MAG: DUF790 family protein [Planctomycetes bacterium]|nr:DUF790 family protein [Planctomycetota bacterium]